MITNTMLIDGRMYGSIDWCRYGMETPASGSSHTESSLFVCVEVLRPSQPNGVMPFLNQRKGENDHRKYFMINLHERMLPTSAGLNPRPPGLQSDGASN